MYAHMIGGFAIVSIVLVYHALSLSFSSFLSLSSYHNDATSHNVSVVVAFCSLFQRVVLVEDACNVSDEARV